MVPASRKCLTGGSTTKTFSTSNQTKHAEEFKKFEAAKTSGLHATVKGKVQNTQLTIQEAQDR